MKYAIGLVLLLCMSACARKQDLRVIFRINGAFNRRFILERMGFNGGEPQVIDSGIARSNHDSMIYFLPVSQPTVYRIQPEYKGYGIPFVHDSSGLAIVYNYNRDDYRFENSPVSEEWRRFQQEQQTIAREMDRLGDQRGSAAVRSTVDSLRKAGVNRNFHFADTTTNPALFLLAYNQVDFDKDYNRLKQFIQRAGRRFPLNTAVQTLVRNTLDYVSTFSSPLQIGDMLPSLQLFDSSGRRRIVGPVKDKYLLVDCWSSWCETCRIFSAAKKTAWQHADTSRFAIVSIAVDAERQAWINILRFEHYPWEQVIDEKMWMGPAARAFHFDSLPYNFFVAPGGRILSKSIPGDSLIPVLAAHGLLRKHT